MARRPVPRSDTRREARREGRSDRRPERRRAAAAADRRIDPAQAQGVAQARIAALVMAGTIVVWMGAQWLGNRLAWEARLVFLFDFAALAAFFWALVVTWRLWRRRQDN
jgi:hypothetical protein